MVRIDHLHLSKLKIMMELSLKELNDLYYCVGKTIKADTKLISDNDLEVLLDILSDEILRMVKIEEEE